jgi:acetolactate synthase-1/2/3 large subunit
MLRESCTSEMHFVAALDRVPGIRCVLGLFEGVVTGAADGYGRMAEKPAVTLLHTGPGFGNGIANLHNARKANTPIVNVVGDHATYHQQYEAPLTSDIMGLARPVSGWVHSSRSSKNVAADGARAVQAACQAPGQIATLILPADTAWLPADRAAQPLPRIGPAPVAQEAIDQVAELLRSGKKCALILGGETLKRRGLDAAGRVAAATGARLMGNTFVPRLARGAGLVSIDQIPYPVDAAIDFLKEYEILILVNGIRPVASFAYPGKRSTTEAEGATITYLSQLHEDGVGALEALADALNAPAQPAVRVERVIPDLPSGALTPAAAGRVIARYLPENAIISNESNTTSAGLHPWISKALPHDQISLTGSAIGQGMPAATGAAVACPDRKVVSLESDGSAMFTVQALWTQARERLDITTVIWSNRAYEILIGELERVGGGQAGPTANSMVHLDNPSLDWVALARGMGVDGSRATTAEEFAQQFATAMRTRGPHLIEAVL